jgi:hypothetical protein
MASNSVMWLITSHYVCFGVFAALLGLIYGVRAGRRMGDRLRAHRQRSGITGDRPGAKRRS